MNSLDLAFMGTPDVAAPSLEAAVLAGHRVRLVVTQPDRPAGRGRRLHRQPVAAMADRMGISLAQPARAGELLDTLRELEPQVLVVLAYGQILSPALLEVASLGAVNVHFSLLPLLRGAAPINRAILEGHAQTGVTTMYMAPELDAGDVILRREVSLTPQETAGTLAVRLAHLGARTLVETLALMAAGQAPREPQDHGAATWAGKLSKDEGRIDWSRPAVDLDRHLRGMDPWPGAFTTLEGAPLKLFAPCQPLDLDHGQTPGDILGEVPGHAQDLVVACGQGALAIGGVQAAGKRRMSAREYLCGAGACVGLRLGS